MEPTTKEVHKVRGDGNIDIKGEITSRGFGYMICTMHEIHEAFDTLVVRQGNVSTDTFVCFTTRYPIIFFRKNKLPMTSHHVVVKFDTWTAYRAGAMTYENSVNQWILTTGLLLESIVMVRDHVGHCLDLDTLTTLERKFMPITPEEPETTIAEMVPGHCVMPSCGRWHCVLTTKEKGTSIGMHLFDWELYQKSWGDEQLSTRHSEIVPPERPLRYLGGQGTKIKQYLHIILLVRNLMRLKNRARVIRKVRTIQKERASARRERSLVRLSVTQKEKKWRGLVESSFLDQQHFLKHGEKGNLKKLLSQVRLKRTSEGQLWCSSRVRMESPFSGEHGLSQTLLQE